MNQENRLYLEDISAGQRFTTASHEIDEAQIIAFARQFDPQPFHIDPEKAKATMFEGLAASGWHTASITMRLLVESGIPLAGGMIGTEANLRWPRPTRPGDILTVFGEIIAVRPSQSRSDRGWVSLRAETRNQRGEVVQTFTSTLLVPRRAGS